MIDDGDDDDDDDDGGGGGVHGQEPCRLGMYRCHKQAGGVIECMCGQPVPRAECRASIHTARIMALFCRAAVSLLLLLRSPLSCS